MIAARAEIDVEATRRTCERLFSYRKAQAWPPVVVKREEWDEMYAALVKGLPVLQNIDDAVRWVNETIVTIDNAR